MFCPHCNETYFAYMIRHTTHDQPVEVFVNINYCPVCGWEEEDNDQNV